MEVEYFGLPDLQRITTTNPKTAQVHAYSTCRRLSIGPMIARLSLLLAS